MFIPGLVSVTFRHLPPTRIIELVQKSGLQAIEWGGDVHVPHGRLKNAEKVRDMTLAAGLQIASYGSYYRVGHDQELDFEQVLATAVSLNASIVRVWPGKQGSEVADEAYWSRVVNDSRRIARMAADAGKIVAYEYHANTLTDTCAGALRLLHTADAPNLRTYWQPACSRSHDRNLNELSQLLPYLCHLHVFYWINRQRLPLETGISEWQAYLKTVCRSSGDHGFLLEFVAGDEPDNFLKDAETLKLLLRKVAV